MSYAIGMIDKENEMEKKITAKDIREYYSHGCGNRKVVVHRDEYRGGRIEYYGAPNDFDRGDDYWHWGGYVDEIKREIAAERATK